MSTTNTDDDILDPSEEADDNVSQDSVKPSDAEEHAPKKVIGIPITKETARAYQLSSTRSKRLRREARQKMLEALTTSMDLGVELQKAMRTHDKDYLDMLEKAVKLIGCHWDQSDEGREQRFAGKVDTTVKGAVTTDLKINFVDAKKPPED